MAAIDRGQRRVAAPPLLQGAVVIPAKAGIQVPPNWIPAFAGMTRQ
ncbi:hypothetical protein [Microbulbifer taiwanensis]